MRIFIRSTVAFLAALTLSASAFAAPGSSTEARPNIVFLLADDARADVFGFLGEKRAPTPNLDRLAREGVVFRQSFVTTSICCASRASIFTGQYTARHGILDFERPLAPEAWANSYPMRLRDAGYFTGFIGKFGVGAAKTLPVSSFDFWRGEPGHLSYFRKPGDTEHLTQRQIDDALAFLKEAPAGRPFCLSISFKAPHAQDGAPREFPPDARDESLFSDLSFSTPADAEDLHALLPEPVRNGLGRKRWAPRFSTPDRAQETIRDYHRLVAGLDREIGRLLDELEERGLAKNTIVVFTSDNGFFLGERGLADKWFPYEDSIRVPLAIRVPGVKPREVAAVALNIDLAPTLLDFAGLPRPASMQGRSLRPLLSGDTPAAWRTEFFYEHHVVAKQVTPSEALRTPRWKYIVWPTVTPASEELYDLSIDPRETLNLAADPSQAETLAQLRARFAELRAAARTN